MDRTINFGLIGVGSIPTTSTSITSYDVSMNFIINLGKVTYIGVPL